MNEDYPGYDMLISIAAGVKWFVWGSDAIDANSLLERINLLESQNRSNRAQALIAFEERDAATKKLATAAQEISTLREQLRVAEQASSGFMTKLKRFIDVASTEVS